MIYILYFRVVICIILDKIYYLIGGIVMKGKTNICSKCGTENSGNEQNCISCGGRLSLPIYKRWWFIAVMLILGLGFFGSLFSEEESKAPIQESEIQEAAVKDEGKSIEEEVPVKTEASLTIGQKNALTQAKRYLSISAFSREGLVEQLVFEGYSNEDAVYGADNSGADWSEQAAKKAKQYLELTSFSRQGLIDQLLFEGFTSQEAEYGVKAVGY